MTLNGDFFKQGGHPGWVVEYLLQRDTLTILAAEPGSAKSLLALGMVYHIAYGAPFCGLNVEKGPVVVFDADNPHSVLLERAQGIKAVIEAQGYTHHDPIDFQHYTGVFLDEEKGLQEMRSIIERIRPVIIIFDNLRAFHTGDENDSRSMDRLASMLHELHKISNAALVAIHHFNKSEGNIFRRLRGSGALLARCDGAVEIRPLRHNGRYVELVGIVPVPRRVQMRLPFRIRISNDCGGIRFSFDRDLRIHENVEVDRISHMSFHILAEDRQERTVEQIEAVLGGMEGSREVRKALRHLENIGAARAKRSGSSHRFVYETISSECPWCGRRF